MSFSFASISHAFASVAKDIVHVAKVLEAGIAKIQKAEPVIEALTSLIDPMAVPLERAAFALLGKALAAAHSTEAAAAANGLNISLDAQEIADLKALAAELKEILKSKGLNY